MSARSCCVRNRLCRQRLPDHHGGRARCGGVDPGVRAVYAVYAVWLVELAGWAVSAVGGAGVAGVVQAMRGGGGDGTQAPGHLAGHPAHFAPFGTDCSVDLDNVRHVTCCSVLFSRSCGASQLAWCLHGSCICELEQACSRRSQEHYAPSAGRRHLSALLVHSMCPGAPLP